MLRAALLSVFVFYIMTSILLIFIPNKLHNPSFVKGFSYYTKQFPILCFLQKHFIFAHNLKCLYRRRSCRVSNTVGRGGPCPHAHKLRVHVPMHTSSGPMSPCTQAPSPCLPQELERTSTHLSTLNLTIKMCLKQRTGRVTWRTLLVLQQINF